MKIRRPTTALLFVVFVGVGVPDAALAIGPGHGAGAANASTMARLGRTPGLRRARGLLRRTGGLLRRNARGAPAHARAASRHVATVHRSSRAASGRVASISHDERARWQAAFDAMPPMTVQSASPGSHSYSYHTPPELSEGRAAQWFNGAIAERIGHTAVARGDHRWASRHMQIAGGEFAEAGDFESARRAYVAMGEQLDRTVADLDEQIEHEAHASTRGAPRVARPSRADVAHWRARFDAEVAPTIRPSPDFASHSYVGSPGLESRPASQWSSGAVSEHIARAAAARGDHRAAADELQYAATHFESAGDLVTAREAYRAARQQTRIANAEFDSRHPGRSSRSSR